jgi:mRNA interferase MazF
MSIPANDENDRVLTTLIPHTTSTRGSRFEIAIASRFLNTGAFDVQNVITIPTIKMIRMLGTSTSTASLSTSTSTKNSQNKIMHRSGRSTALDFRNHFGGHSVMVVVRRLAEPRAFMYDLGPRVALSHQSPWFIS